MCLRKLQENHNFGSQSEREVGGWVEAGFEVVHIEKEMHVKFLENMTEREWKGDGPQEAQQRQWLKMAGIETFKHVFDDVFITQ